MLENKEAYKHDFDGACAPGWLGTIGQQTFSVGIFQWLPKANGKGLKRSPVCYRVKGSVSNDHKVYKRAREVCRLLDKGEILKTKQETVK